MNLLNKFILTAFLLLISVLIANGQIDEICASAGVNPSLDSPFAHVPYIYGRVVLKDWDPSTKFPKVTVIYADSQQSRERIILEKNGNFCFKRKSSSGGLIVEVDGIEMAQRTIPSLGAAQQREDFEIYLNKKNQLAPPEVISAQFYYPPNPKTSELYKKITDAETKNDAKKTLEYLKEIVAIDSLDFIAWAKLGVLYFSQDLFTEADAAFRKCLELKIEFTPAWINVGKMRVVQNQFAAAIEIFKHALELEPKSAKTYRLLGETFLRNKQGTLGAEALNKAIELDPLGMAECHLLLAHLYELAKANKLAAQEYKLFLKKVPAYKDKKRLEDFIKNNPE